MTLSSEVEILLQLGLAAILGGLVGFEREWQEKPAGLRTNMLIAVASALFISLGRVVVVDFETLISDQASGVDPIRVLHAIIVGVTVLGGGTILKGVDGGEIKYLTTAATILMASAIGISVALRQYWLAVGATLLVLIINRLFSYLGDLINKKNRQRHKKSH